MKLKKYWWIALIVIAVYFISNKSDYMANEKFDVVLNTKLLEAHKTFSTISPDTKYKVMIETKDNKDFISKYPITVVSRLDELNIIAASLTETELMGLSKNNDIVKIYYNNELSFSGTSAENLNMMQETPVNKDIGKGVRVCILDSGIDSNAESNVILKKTFNWDGDIEGEAIDNYGHGTAVKNIVSSIVPGAEILIGKIGDFGPNEYTMISGMFWCLNNGARVITISSGIPWGGDCDSLAAGSTINSYASRKPGVIVTVAAGNQLGYSHPSINYPACASGAIAVSATTIVSSKTGLPNMIDPADYDLRHPPVAEGISAIDIAADGAIDKDLSGRWKSIVEGTSFATPYVAGSAAALISIDKTKTAQQIKDLLYKGATKENPGILPAGNGILNLASSCSLLLNDKLPTCNGYYISNLVSEKKLDNGKDLLEIKIDGAELLFSPNSFSKNKLTGTPTDYYLRKSYRVQKINENIFLLRDKKTNQIEELHLWTISNGYGYLQEFKKLNNFRNMNQRYVLLKFVPLQDCKPAQTVKCKSYISEAKTFNTDLFNIDTTKLTFIK